MCMIVCVPGLRHPGGTSAFTHADGTAGTAAAAADTAATAAARTASETIEKAWTTMDR